MNDIFFENSKINLVENIETLKEVFHDESLNPRNKNLKLRSKLHKLSETKWTIIEETFMEIEIDYRTQVITEQIDKIPPVTKRIERLEEVLKEEFKEHSDLCEILVSAIPDPENVRRWLKKPEWKEEVDKRMRNDELFSIDKRHRMIDAIYQQGLRGSAKHAQMYLTMSGDLGKSNEKDPVERTFESIQKALAKK